ncbi:DNA polymerase III subunit delta' [bacterium]
MSFGEIIGQERAISILKNAKTAEKISHAYIFAGPIGVGKKRVALEFAKWLNCMELETSGPCDSCRSCKKVNNLQHPEIRVYEEEKANISIQKVREIQRDIQYKRTESKYRVVIIDEAEKLTLEAANCFLKALEEPPEGTIIILVTSSISGMLKTIISRCQIIRFKNLSFDEKIAILKNLTDYSLEHIREAFFVCGENISETELFLNSSEKDEIKRFIEIKTHLDKREFSSNLQREFEILAKDKVEFARFLNFLINKKEINCRNNNELINEDIQFLLKVKTYLNRNVNPRLLWAWIYLNESQGYNYKF